MEYVIAFAVGGIICVIGQLLLDLAKLTPAHVMSSFVVAGAILDGFGLYDKLIEFGTTVESAEYIDTEDKQGKEWVLTLRKLVSTKAGIKNLWWQERFDAVVVASGHYHLPAIPDIPGLIEYDKTYPGKITHSKYYRQASDYAGKVSENFAGLALCDLGIDQRWNKND